MARYIDADKVEQGKIQSNPHGGDYKPTIRAYMLGWNDAIDTILDIATVDVVPVVHAHWIEDHGDLICSNCYECYSDEIVFMSRCKDVYDLPHCPECGAKMDEVVE